MCISLVYIIIQIININVVLSQRYYNYSFISTKPLHLQNNILNSLHKVTFVTPQGEKIINCEEDEYVLDSAESAGLDLPYSCRGGSCSTCNCMLLDGEMSNEDQSYLTEDELKKGYRLICTAYPHSECRIMTHKEDELHKLRGESQ